MTAHLKIKASEVAPLRAHYHGVAQTTLRKLWSHKFVIAAFLLAGLQAGAVAVVLLPSRYTSEAMLQVNFSREEPNAGARMQRIASPEAVAVVESATRIIRSRGLASAVVSRLGLDAEQDLARPSAFRRAIWHARKTLGMAAVLPSSHDIATERLMGALRVNIEPRSYVISIGMTAEHPDRAAQFANAFGLEYLRAERLQQLAEMEKSTERELGEMATVYGTHHPRRLAAQAKLDELRAHGSALRNGGRSSGDASVLNKGELLPAEAVTLPSGPSATFAFAFALFVSLLASAAVILLLELRASR